MKNIKKISAVCAMSLVLSITFGGIVFAEEAKSAEELSGKVTVWDWDVNRIGSRLEEFNKVYPNIEVEIVPLSSADDYKTKIVAAIAAGTDLPDIGCMEMGMRYDLVNLGIWDDLTAEPYNFDPSTVVEYTNELNKTEDGTIVAIESTLCPTGLAYKKNLTEKYFGTSDPAELEKMFPDWETALEYGKKFKEENPDVYFFSSGDNDLMGLFSNQLVSSYATEDGEFNEEALKPMVHYVYEFLTTGLSDRLQGYSTAWFDQFNNDDNYIFDICANWSPQYNIEPNDTDHDDQWGFMKAPGGALSSGGTSLAVCSTSDVKEEAWALIEWMLLSEDGAKIYKDNIGYYAPLTSLYEDEEFLSWKTACFGSQDVGAKLYKELVNEMTVRKLSKYDSAMTKGATSWMTLLYTGIDNMTEEECFNSLLDEVAANMN